MHIAIGSDHGGFNLKRVIVALIEAEGHTVLDVGCDSQASVDYPDFGEALSQALLRGDVERGVLICGTGIGMSMVANRHHKIRAALCHDEYTARMSREHNDANVLCLGARVTGPGVAEGIVSVWLKSSFAGGRHQSRIGKFSE